MTALTWIYFLTGLTAAISITLTHLSEAHHWRFWVATAAVVVAWPVFVILAYREMWRETEGADVEG